MMRRLVRGGALALLLLLDLAKRRV